jgi:hypothetical protein
MALADEPALALPPVDPQLILHVTRVRTQSGSRYDIYTCFDGRCFVAADHVISPTSQALGSTTWQVEPMQPWPPALGQPLFFVSAYFAEAKSHPDRAPGGGKITSPVVDIAVCGVAGRDMPVRS